MSTATLLDEQVLYIGEEPQATRVTFSHRCFAAWLGVGLSAGVVTLLLSVAIHNWLREFRREQCMKQLKVIGVAMHEYNEKHGHFPAPAILDREGSPRLSWRVAILPQMGYGSLFERFHLDEPWDSPHNRALIGEMPREFACPAGPARRAGKTGYRVIVGPENDGLNVNTPFAHARGAKIPHFIDGLSNTILVLETDTYVPWTKPDDIQWTKGDPLPRVASPHPDGAHALFADSATRFLKRTIDPNILLALLTMNGSEVISGDG